CCCCCCCCYCCCCCCCRCFCDLFLFSVVRLLFFLIISCTVYVHLTTAALCMRALHADTYAYRRFAAALARSQGLLPHPAAAAAAAATAATVAAAAPAP